MKDHVPNANLLLSSKKGQTFNGGGGGVASKDKSENWACISTLMPSVTRCRFGESAKNCSQVHPSRILKKSENVQELSGGAEKTIAIVFQNSCVLVGGLAHLSRDALQNGISHSCACVKISAKGGGVLHHLGGVLTFLRRYHTIWRIATIISQ